MSLGTSWVDLGNPAPLDEPHVYEPFRWIEDDGRPLARIDAVPFGDFFHLTQARRSCRTFRGAITESDLGALLFLSAYAGKRASSALGFDLLLTPAPSAGAIHGVHLLVQPSETSGLFRYDRVRHRLLGLNDSSTVAAQARKLASQTVPLGPAALLFLVAEPGRYSAKYENSASLVWRDAGVLLGYLALAAESLGMGFCPLGLTGNLVADALDSHSKLAGVGMAVLGAR